MVSACGAHSGIHRGRWPLLLPQASFLVGLCYAVLGLVRLGFLTKFLSHSVISGFTSGAAIIIGFSQVSRLRQVARMKCTIAESKTHMPFY
mmetsp:Transcript_32924/g.84134  ORF Transcript_32924/g.84134 Transcript_32924/m.84134 type:complete len:91 (-) Transcript_32924:268-540(-)